MGRLGCTCLLALALLDVALGCRGVRFLRLNGRSSDLGLTDEDGTWLDGEGCCFDVTDHFGSVFDFNAITGDNVAVNFSVDDYRFGFDLGFDDGVFSDGEGTLGADFAVNFTIYKEVIGESDGTNDGNVIAENVALAACWCLRGRSRGRR